MKVVFERDSLVGLATVNVLRGDYLPLVNGRIRDYAGRIKVNGFRSGSVPFDYVRSVYGGGLLRSELGRLAGSFLADYIRGNGINVVGEPVLEETNLGSVVDFDSDYYFKYRVGFAGDFSVSLSKDVVVDDYVVSGVGADFLSGYADYVRFMASPRCAVDVCGSGGLVSGVLNVGGYSKGISLYLRVDDVLDGSRGDFVGCRVGDSISFRVSDVLRPGFALCSLLFELYGGDFDLDGVYSFSVGGVFDVDLMGFDVSLFDRVFGVGVVKTRDGFDARLRDYLIAEGGKYVSLFLLNGVRNCVLDGVSIDLPYGFIRERLNYDDRVGVDSGFDFYYKKYLRGVRWSCVCSSIANDNGISVSDDEVGGLASRYFGGVGVSDARVVDFLSSGGNYHRLYNELLVDKVLGFIKDRIGVVSSNINFEDLSSIMYVN